VLAKSGFVESDRTYEPLLTLSRSQIHPLRPGPYPSSKKTIQTSAYENSTVIARIESVVAG